MTEQSMSACGRKLPLTTSIFKQIERPLSVKADVHILTLEISLPSDRYTPVSGHHADTMSRGRYRPNIDTPPRFLDSDRS